MLTVCSLWLWNNYFFFGHNKGYLADYEWVDGPIRVADNAGQSSGLAFNSKLKQLYVIVNSPQEIHILTAVGQYIRTVTLHGFEDTEGLVYLGDDNFALVDERSGTIAWFAIHAETQSVEFDAKQSIRLFTEEVGNIGLEGITFSEETQQLFAVKERKPKQIYSIQWPVEDIHQPVIRQLWDAETLPWWSVRNYSGIHYHPPTGHLFIVSRRSRRIIEYTHTGQEVGSFSLKAGLAKLQQTIGKAEGIVISDDGTLYLCGELNQLYIFKKRLEHR